MQLGAYHFDRPIVLAPMAGISDRPFRRLCMAHGADYAVSEMVTSVAALHARPGTRRRLDRSGECAPHIVQIAGAAPEPLAHAARVHVDEGAEVIDINMGCPARKVCNRMAGSALLRDERLVGRLLEAVVRACRVPVTLKMRTGWDLTSRNGVTIARIAEQAGVRALTVHGRTRACRYHGAAEYDSIAEIKAAVAIPVIANGDIRTPDDARRVLDYTAADGIMIGRGAQGNPWIFAQIKAYLARGARIAAPARDTVLRTLRGHLEELHEFYGARLGPRIARKHAGWYVARLADGEDFRRTFNLLDTPEAQLAHLDEYRQRYAGARAA